MDIFSFCGNSGIFEFTSEKSLNDFIWSPEGKNITSVKKLEIAIDLAKGLADLHNVDKKGQASIAHTDIVSFIARLLSFFILKLIILDFLSMKAPGQYLLVNGTFKLNDFNRARFMRWDVKSNKPCGYTVANNPGVFRAPGK